MLGGGQKREQFMTVKHKHSAEKKDQVKRALMPSKRLVKKHM